MILADQGNMNDGTFIVSVYSGEPVMDINKDSRATAAKCEGIGANAQGGTVNCGGKIGT